MSRALKVPTVPVGSGCMDYQLAPGVYGYAIEVEGEIWIPYLRFDREGSCAVGRFLDRLPDNVAIPNVISPRLLGMMRRRGWTRRLEPTPHGPIEIWRPGLCARWPWRRP